MIKGGLVWLFWQVGGVVVDVVDHRGNKEKVGVTDGSLTNLY